MEEVPLGCLQWMNGNVSMMVGNGLQAGNLRMLRNFKMAGATKAWRSVVRVEF